MSSRKSKSAASELTTAEQYFRAGRSDMAELLLRQLLERDPKSARACELMAYILGNRGDLKGCEAMLQRACSLPDASGEAFFYLGRVQLNGAAAEAATRSFERALALAGPSFEVLHELGVAHSRLGRHEAALAAFVAAERQRPRIAPLHFNMGRTLEALQRLDEALGHYERSLQLDPRQAGAWSNRGVVLTGLQRAAEAIDSFDRALALEPDDVATLCNKAAALNAMKRRVEALACYEAAMRLAPQTDDLPGNWLHTRLSLCRWDGLAEAFGELLPRAARGERVAAPFALLATPADAPTLLAACLSYARAKYPARPLPATTRAAADSEAPPQWRGTDPAPADAARKIRLGYFSADFYDHATSQLMARLFELHDRERFELIGFSFGPQEQDAMRERVVAAFDRFIDVSSRTDSEIAAQARLLGVDIAIDLKGFTTHARCGIFAERAAPVQVNYLGFPGTMGCDYIDYIVADETLIRPGDEAHYTEKVVRLPHCYQANDDTKRIAPSLPAREAFGLPGEGFVFCCFNNNYKITPEAFDIWMRLLHRVPGSVLWLYRSDDEAAAQLQGQAGARGIDAARIVWAKHMELPEHLARHAHADLFLDTFHYNAHTTASDALWAGLPVLTLEGATFASRVAASLLKGIGMPELICRSPAEYEQAAFAIATSRQRASELKQRLAEHRTREPLFDSARFARSLEEAFATMHERRRQGLAPDHFRVAGPA